MLAMALVGYEIEKSKIEERIKQIRAQMSAAGKTPHSPGDSELSENGIARKRRKFSASARKRMAAAQRKRWAEKRKEPVAA